MPTDPNAVEPTIEPTVPDAGTTGTQPDYKALYETQMTEANTWKQRFTGLQGKYQQEQSRWADDATQLVDAQSQLNEVSGIREQLEVQVSTLNEQLDTAKTEGVIATEQLDRVTLVTTEFPQLVPFLQDELIPDGTGDELRTKLTAMSTRIDTMQDQKVATHVEGASPSAAPAAVNDNNPANLLKQSIEAMKSGNLDDYSKYYDQYLKASQGGQ